MLLCAIAKATQHGTLLYKVLQFLYSELKLYGTQLTYGMCAFITFLANIENIFDALCLPTLLHVLRPTLEVFNTSRPTPSKEEMESNILRKNKKLFFVYNLSSVLRPSLQKNNGQKQGQESKQSTVLENLKMSQFRNGILVQS